MTNNDMYLTVWQVWSLVFVTTQQTLIMVKEILNFPDHGGQRAEVKGAVFFKDTPRMGSSKGASHHNAFLHLKLDFIGIYANEVLIPHVWSRVDPHHSHCELKNFQRKSTKNKNHESANPVMTTKKFHLPTVSDAINANRRTFNLIQRLFVNF